MKILIFGAGYLGKRFSASIPGAVLFPLDITDRTAVLTEIRACRPDAVINCAGKTGTPNVDWCETHQLETQRSNVLGPIVLSEACAAAGVYLLHLGSGCIFYGISPTPGGWREDDVANPSAFYSRTKCAADLLLSRLPNVGIVRIRMPIDATPAPRNLITKLARYSLVADVENSVTVVDDLISIVQSLVKQRATGIFHATNPGTLRHRDLLRLYSEIVEPGHSYSMITEDDLVARGLVARPRSNCILASNRLAELGIAMPSINAVLPDIMRGYARRKSQEP